MLKMPIKLIRIESDGRKKNATTHLKISEDNLQGMNNIHYYGDYEKSGGHPFEIWLHPRYEGYPIRFI
jgi:hypothetical protein